FKILEAMRFSDRSYEKPPKNSREAYARVRADLTQINEDQEGARGRVASRLEGVASEAPELAVEAAEHGMRKALYLFANMPVEAKVGKLQRGVSGGPSDSDIDSFARLARAVNNPVTVLEDILARRLSTEGAKGARETDVQLVEEMKAEILTAVDENGTTPNYETRLQLSLLFGEPMDPTLEPRFVKAMQETYAVEADEKSLTQPLKSTRDLKSISAAASAMQRLESAGPA
ncbi:MAG TPA: hypothetical protein VJP78_01600, partial [Thermoleophilia bacterium]|nr:hypothetical protein [Thermoleophilia bacterium]